MRAEIWVDGSFEASHFLPHMPVGHPCRRVHGHSYRVRVWLEGPVDDDNGIVVDFDVVKRSVDQVLKQLDHHDLNTVISNPTAENVAGWILERMLPSVWKVELREVAWAGVAVTRLANVVGNSAIGTAP